MKYISIYRVIILILIIGIIGFYLGTYLTKWLKPSIYEGARTLPRPTRHPPNNNSIWVRPIGPAYQGQTMNQFIDIWINQLFDTTNHNLPFQNTLDYYTMLCVNQGNVTEMNKRRLTDICDYLLINVLPNIPTESNPNPTISWPAIEWLSDSWLPLYNISTNAKAYSNTWYSYAWQLNNSTVTGGFDYGAPLNSDGSGGNSGSGGNGGSGGSGGSGGCSNNGCGTVCPTSCFANAFALSNDGGSGGSGGNGGNSGSDGIDVSGHGHFSGTLNERKRNAIPHTNTVIIGNNTIPFTITDASQTNMTVPSPLNEQINSMINQYFIQSGQNQNRPTQYMIDQINMYTAGREPMDQFHKNKLRDLIYYIMENIIPGLPTDKLPISYVEWKPIQWLSHSEL